jgi:hypothetical protein
MMMRLPVEKIEAFKEAVANDLVIEMQRRVAVDTGFLQGNIIYQVLADKAVVSMPYYWRYVEFGTPPHIIEAVNKKSLHWKKDGQDFFAKKVNHPGCRPQPFVRPSLAGLGRIVKNNLDLLR